MTESDPTGSVAQFSKTAKAYVTSAAHAMGEDLLLLARHVGHRRYKRALDVAAGGGHATLTVAPFCDEVIASDLTPAMLDAARGHIEGKGVTNVKFEVAAAERLPYPNEYFDLVTCRIAAHHFHSIARFSDEAYRVLVPGGTFVLIDSVAPQPAELDAFINWVEKRRDPSHQRSYTEEEWRHTLARSGFVVVWAELVEKVHPFTEWTARAGMSEEDAVQLSREILAYDPKTLVAFDVRCDPETSRVVSFADLKLFIKAVKPPLTKEDK